MDADLFINQIRNKVGVVFGSTETTTGGNALKFYASMRLDVRRIGALKNGETAVGNRTKVKVVKNKVAAPFREVEFDILYGQGISRSGDILDMAAEGGIVEKAGAWYSYKGERIGQGREAAKTFIEERPEMMAKIEHEVLVKHGVKKAGVTNGAATDKAEAAAAAKKERPKAQA